MNKKQVILQVLLEAGILERVRERVGSDTDFEQLIQLAS